MKSQVIKSNQIVTWHRMWRGGWSADYSLLPGACPVHWSRDHQRWGNRCWSDEHHWMRVETWLSKVSIPLWLHAPKSPSSRTSLCVWCSHQLLRRWLGTARRNLNKNGKVGNLYKRRPNTRPELLTQSKTQRHDVDEIEPGAIVPGENFRSSKKTSKRRFRNIYHKLSFCWRGGK